MSQLLQPSRFDHLHYFRTQFVSSGLNRDLHIPLSFLVHRSFSVFLCQRSGFFFCEGPTFTSKGEYRPYNKDRRQRVRAPGGKEKASPPPSPSTGGPAKNLYTESEILILSYSVTWAWSERVNL